MCFFYTFTSFMVIWKDLLVVLCTFLFSDDENTVACTKLNLQ
jgi:hypothetical protein